MGLTVHAAHTDRCDDVCMHAPTRYGAPPLYYASCCDGFQDVFASDMAVYLEWGFLETARGVLDNYFT